MDSGGAIPLASTAATSTHSRSKAIRTSLLPFWPESGNKTSIYHSTIHVFHPKFEEPVIRIQIVSYLSYWWTNWNCMLMTLEKADSNVQFYKYRVSNWNMVAQGESYLWSCPTSFTIPSPHLSPGDLPRRVAGKIVVVTHRSCSALTLLASKGVSTAYQNTV